MFGNKRKLVTFANENERVFNFPSETQRKFVRFAPSFRLKGLDVITNRKRKDMMIQRKNESESF